MSRPSFFAELKRRNVYKVGAMYLVGGWLLVQVATQVGPLFDLSATAMRWLVIALVAGFPIALIVSWVYDLTPQGIVRTDDESTDPDSGRVSGQLLNRAIIGLLLLAVVVLLAKVFWPQGAAVKEQSESAASIAKTAVGENKSIAVLPFENRSSDKENAYFADGIQDEILTRLAKIGALKVISRTSTQHYASSPDNLPVIAKQLGVAHILEGSVQKVGDQVRITVQLIEASTDTHLWAETYDRKLIDILGVESEVAKAIADTLQAKLTGGETQELAVKPTENAAAYDAWLHGLASEARAWYEAPALEAAAGFYAQAAQLDPRFAQAWARLSWADAWLVFRLQDTSAARREASKQALDKAVALAPDSTDTLIAQGYYRYWIEHDYPAARLLFEQLRTKLPSNSEVLRALTAIARRQGFWDQSLAYSEQAIALSPRDPEVLASRAWTYAITRRYTEAIKTLDRRLEIVPGDADTIVAQVQLYQAQGQLEQARQLLARLSSDQGSINVAGATISQSLLEHDYAKAVELLKAALAKPEFAAGANGANIRASLGLAQSLAGDAVGAKATYVQARSEFEAMRASEPDNPGNAGQLALVYAALGEKALALKEGERAMALLPASRDPILGPVQEEAMAAVEAQVGETGRAVDRLRHLLSINYSSNGGPITTALLRLDPIWNPLRGDPRFQKLIAEGDAATP